MKKIFLILTAFCFNFLIAQVNTFKPNTGDKEMDGFLSQVNADAQKDLNAFTGMIKNKFNIVKTDVDNLLKDMLPGDVYMAAQVATVIGKPVTEVSVAYNKNKGKGWGQIAKEMGIKPGSPEFHKLKKSMKSNGKGPGEEKQKGGEEEGHGKGNGKGKGHGKK